MKVMLVVDVFPKVSTTFIAAKFIALVDRGIDAHIVCWTSDPSVWSKVTTLAERPELARRVHLVPGLARPRSLIGPALAGGGGPAERIGRAAAGLGIRAGRRASRANSAAEANRESTISGSGGFGAWVEALDPDLIHFEFGARAARILQPGHSLGRPVIVSFRGYDLNCVGLDEPNYYQGVWDGADALHFLGNDLWRRAVRRGCPPDKFHVLIPPAVDTDYFSPAAPADAGLGGTEEDRTEVDAALGDSQGGDASPPVDKGGRGGPGEPKLRVLSVGRLHWKKGSEWSLEAVRLLGERGVAVDLRIVGDGSESEAVAAAIVDLGLSDQVTMLGSRRRPEVREELAAADVFVHPAVSEGFCNSVMEAQAMAVPVVCTDADGLGENVADGQTGFVVPRRDPAAMADRLATLASDGALRRQMGEAGRRRVAGKFRPADQINAFLDLYDQVHTGPSVGHRDF
ncbi:MAG: glycosyltransferase family 4 protein [Acidimicrobiales bacterium]